MLPPPHRYLAIKHAVVTSLRALRNRVSTLGVGGRVSFLQQPLFRVYLCYARMGTALRPSLASVQHALNDVAKRMVLLPRGVKRWTPAVVTRNLVAATAPADGSSGGHSAGNDADMEPTFFDTFARSRAVLVVVLQLSGTLVGVEKRVGTYVERFER